MMPEQAHPQKNFTILIAEDDQDDRLMLREALEQNRLASDLRFVSDGEELMEYLLRSGPYSSPQNSPVPGLILLDLNMPRKDGIEVLKELKTDPHLRTIPVVVLTTSRAEEDVTRTYDLGVNSFITKPVSFDGLLTLTRDLGKYWFELVELPRLKENG